MDVFYTPVEQSQEQYEQCSPRISEGNLIHNTRAQQCLSDALNFVIYLQW